MPPKTHPNPGLSVIFESKQRPLSIFQRWGEQRNIRGTLKDRQRSFKPVTTWAFLLAKAKDLTEHTSITWKLLLLFSSTESFRTTSTSFAQGPSGGWLHWSHWSTSSRYLTQRCSLWLGWGQFCHSGLLRIRSCTPPPTSLAPYHW